MTNKKISALSSATTPLAGTEILPIVQSSATVKASIANIQTSTYSGGTANGVAYLNGSNVLTTGSAITFDGTNLLLGTTNTSIAAGEGIKILNDSPKHISTVSSVSTNAGGESFIMYSTGAAAYRFYVGWGGTIFATSIVITAISDERLKENIRDLDTGLSAIMALKPRRFDWKDGKGQDKKNAAGFIAQEFEDVFPECVSASKAGEDGIEYKNINHETLIPTLVKAIQELKTEFDAYKASHP